MLTALAVSCTADTAPEPQVEQLKQLSLEELGNIEVTTASKEPEQVWRTPAAVFVLTQEDIRRSGATSIPEVLRLVPGVEVARIDSSTWSVGIRGFGSGFSKSVLVLIDGRNVYTPLFAGVYWRQQNVLLEDVERIEVVRGPGATIWGSNAVNGVINIITKNSKDTHGTLVSVGGGNSDLGMGGFRFGNSYGERLDYRVYGMAFARSPEFHVDRNNFDDWQLGQGGFRMDWNNKSRNALTLQGDIYKGAVGERQTIANFSPPESLDITGVKHVSGGNLLARWLHKFDEKSDVQLQAYYDRSYRFGAQLEESRNTYDLDLVHHMAGWSRQNIIWGAGARWSPGDIHQTAETVNFLPHHQADNLYSVFGQDEIELVKSKLSSTLGAKFEHNIYTGWEVQPSLRLLWTPGNHQTVWAAITRAVRIPSRIDEDLQLFGLFSAAPPLPIFLEITGNPRFRSETTVGYELGYRKLIKTQLYVDISLFHNDYDNLTSYGQQSISLEPSAAPERIIVSIPWANGIKGSTDGIEIAPDWKPNRAFELRASYSYLNLNLRNKPGSDDLATVQTDEGSSPRHQLVLQSFIHLPNGFELDPTYRYVSALPGQFPGSLLLEHVQSYGTLDTRVGFRVSPNVQLSVVGQNLFQSQHAEFGGDTGPLVGVKRSIYAKIVWTR